MNSEKKQISKNRVKISVKVDATEMEEHFENEYIRLAPTVTLPGFRAGKAPRVMTIEAIGQARLSQAALEKGIDQAYRLVLAEHKVFPVTPPSVSISKHPSFSGSSDQNELHFEVEFDILPEAKIGDYKKFKVSKIEDNKVEVSDEEVDKVVDYLRRQAAEFKEIDREAKAQDWAQISFEGSVKHVVKEKLSTKSFPMVISETKLIPGFEEQLLKMKKGEEKEFDLEIPKDFQDKEFAGEKVHFKLNLEDLKEIVLPKITTEFLTKFGLQSEKELRDNIKKSLIEEKKQRERQLQIAQLSDQIIKSTKVEIPKSLIENEKQRMKNVLTGDLSQKGLTLEGYLQNVNLTEKKLEEDLEEQAKRNIMLGVGLGEIAKKENIDLGSQDGTGKVFDYLVENNAK